MCDIMNVSAMLDLITTLMSSYSTLERFNMIRKKCFSWGNRT